ncbi:MAG: crossover junction endodeoxyribonuclease RuvC [Rikenellaceae bacterium]
MRIVGIDPGTNKMGYGVIETSGNKAEVVAIGYIDLTKFSDPYAKLAHIFKRVSGIIEEYSPEEMALEAPFYDKNVQSMLKLGRAQGVAMAAALNKNVDVFEYAPRKIKIAITGNGAASKEQVATMLQKILKIKEMPKNLDASDGLAVALCHHYRRNNPLASAESNSWADFISKNPNKIIKR